MIRKRILVIILLLIVASGGVFFVNSKINGKSGLGSMNDVRKASDANNNEVSDKSSEAQTSKERLKTSDANSSNDDSNTGFNDGSNTDSNTGSNTGSNDGLNNGKSDIGDGNDGTNGSDGSDGREGSGVSNGGDRTDKTDKSGEALSGDASSGNGTSKTISKTSPTPKPSTEPKKEPALSSVVISSVDKKAKTIARGAVTFNDYLEVFKVLSGKLSIGEIKYLFDSAKDQYWETTSVEDIENARKVLFGKLSDADLSKLREIGKKYGRSMDIIKKDLDVAETKENQMRSKGLIK